MGGHRRCQHNVLTTVVEPTSPIYKPPQPLEWSDDRYLATRVTLTLDNTAASAGLVRHLGAIAAH